MRLSIWEGSLSTVHATLTAGAFLTGYALWLGADGVTIGLLSAIPTLAGLVQILASYLTEKQTERKRFTAVASFAGRALWLPVLLLPLLFSHRVSLSIFLMLYALSFALQNAVVPVWMSWMSDLVPADHRGRYFGRRNMVAGIGGMLAGLPAAWFLDYCTRVRHAPALGFGTLFGVAVAFGAAGYAVLMRQPEPPRHTAAVSGPAGMSGVLAYFRAPLADRKFRALLVFSTLLGLGQNFAAPFFTVFALQNLRLNYTVLQLFATISGLASLLTMPLWGSLSDKVGNRALLGISVWGVFTSPIAWAFTTRHNMPLTYALLTELNIVSGVFWAGAGLTQFNLLIAASPSEKTPVYVATMAAVTGLVGGAAPLMGGALMSALGTWHALWFGIPVTNFHVTFLVSAALRLTAIVPLLGVSDDKSATARDVIQQLTRARPRAWLQMRQLQGGSLDARLRATEALGETRTALAAGELQTALQDPSHEVRLEAARALGEIGDPRSVFALIDALADPAPEVVEEAARALARLGVRDATGPLSSLVLGYNVIAPRHVQIAAIRALGILGGTDAADALMQALDSARDEETTEALVRALGQVGDTRATDALVSVLEKPETPRGVRLTAIRSVGEIADARALPAIRQCLGGSSDDPSLLPAVADALARLGDMQSAMPLLDSLRVVQSPVARRQVTHAAARLLGEGDAVYDLLSKDPLSLDSAIAKLVSDLQRLTRSPGAARTLRVALEAFTRADYSRSLSAIHRVAAAARSGPYPGQEALRQLIDRRGDDPPQEFALLALCLLRPALAASQIRR